MEVLVDIFQQGMFVREQSKITTWVLTKSIPFLLAVGSFFFARWQLGNFAWYRPFKYGDGDIFFILGLFKRLVDSTWYFNSEYLGFPFGSSILDFPASDAGHFAVVKILAVLTPNLALVLNLYVLLGFSVTAIASYWVLQQLHLTKISSSVGAILFTFLPFHFLRLDHIFLSWYFSIPLYTYFAFRIFLKQPLFFQLKGYASTIATGLTLLVLSCFGVYYAFFASLIFISSGIVASLKWKSSQNIFSALIAVAIISTGVGLNVAPNVNFWHKNGPNQAAFIRYSFESELYGLKMTQMLLPHPRHHFHRLESTLQQYEASHFLINENQTASLGAIGTIGLLTLLAIFFSAPFLGFQIDNRLQLLSFLSIFLFLFATVGGFSSIFTTFISPMIRGWNRASIFIDFFAITGFFVLFEILFKKISNPKYFTGNFIIIALLLCVFGIWEQSIVKDKNYLAFGKKEYDSDQHFIAKIEASIPNGAIYQLPYLRFPEASINNCLVYGLIRGYLHSSTLHWSYGGMKERKGDLFFRNLADKPLAEQVRVIKSLGFNGVYIDRRGYTDRGKAVETELRKILSIKPLVSDDEYLVFFPMINQEK